MSSEAIAIVGVGAALLAVLVPLLLALGRRMDRMDARIDGLAAALETLRADLHGEIETLRTDLHGEIEAWRTELRADIGAARTDQSADAALIRAELAEVRRDVHALSERVARIEGALTGPWRPPNGGAPAASPSASPAPEREATA